jgi:hypothetical protein
MSEFTLDQTDDVVVISLDGVAVAEYSATSDVAPVDTPKPYFHPLRTPAGVVVTGFAPEDHTWHHGLSFAFPRVGDHNLWGGGTYLSPEEGYHVREDQGSLRHTGWNEVSVGDQQVSIAHDVEWLGHAGEHLIDESRVWRLKAADDALIIDLVTVLHNTTDTPLPLATPAQRGRPDGGYGGLWLRLGEDFAAEALLADDATVTESGAESRTLVVHGRTGSGEAVTLGLSFAPGVSPGAQKWLYRFEPFSAIGWAVAYDEGLEIPVGGKLSFAHRLALLDGHVDAELVRALL